jgi:hypothetical protein
MQRTEPSLQPAKMRFSVGWYATDSTREPEVGNDREYSRLPVLFLEAPLAR